MYDKRSFFVAVRVNIAHIETLGKLEIDLNGEQSVLLAVNIHALHVELGTVKSRFSDCFVIIYSRVVEYFFHQPFGIFPRFWIVYIFFLVFGVPTAETIRHVIFQPQRFHKIAYQVKHADKGRVEEFDIGVYNREAYAERTRREFRQLLSNAQVFYCFQPIFSARSGRVVAYEALMRSDLPTLRSPATIMKLAREQGALYEIERITFTKALETFDSLCRAGSVSGDAMLFVNSIANTCLSHEDGKYINNHWHELCRRMVVEITEEEAIDYEALERKRNAPGFSGMFALDDYGSGYSNENTLLQLAPRFVKVDITIIRGIDTSPDKQQILRNVVAYAHPRSMKIVAEGVETAAELRTVIELGADLLQGYFLARPAIVPGDMAPEAAAIIRELQRRKKD